MHLIPRPHISAIDAVVHAVVEKANGGPDLWYVQAELSQDCAYAHISMDAHSCFGGGGGLRMLDLGLRVHGLREGWEDAVRCFEGIALQHAPKGALNVRLCVGGNSLNGITAYAEPDERWWGGKQVNKIYYGNAGLCGQSPAYASMNVPSEARSFCHEVLGMLKIPSRDTATGFAFPIGRRRPLLSATFSMSAPGRASEEMSYQRRSHSAGAC